MNNIPVDVKKSKISEFYHKYVKSYNEFCEEEKSKFYSYNFKKEKPEEDPQLINYEWKNINGMTIGIKNNRDTKNKETDVENLNEKFKRERLPSLIQEFNLENKTEVKTEVAKNQEISENNFS